MCLGIYYRPIYDRKLRKASKTTNFSFKNKKFRVKIVDVYDGDTCTVVFRHRGRLEQYKVRLQGYDSPEMRPPKDQSNREQEIKAAKEAKDAFLKKIRGSTLVELECHGWDKYGRILGTIYLPRSWIPYRSKVNLNKWMIEKGYGYLYDGGTKKQYTGN